MKKKKTYREKETVYASRKIVEKKDIEIRMK